MERLKKEEAEQRKKEDEDRKKYYDKQRDFERKLRYESEEMHKSNFKSEEERDRARRNDDYLKDKNLIKQEAEEKINKKKMKQLINLKKDKLKK